MVRNSGFLFGSALVLAILAPSQTDAQVNLQYIVPQDGSGAPDPSLIDVRLDDGTDDSDQGLQTMGDANDNYTIGALSTGFVDGRTVLARSSGPNEVGLRTNGNMNSHGSNANTWSIFETNQLWAQGFRASINVWLPDEPNLGPVASFPPTFPAEDRYVANGARLGVPIDDLGIETGFGVRTNENGEMVLYASVAYSEYDANPSAYEYVIPDRVSPAEGATRNNLAIIDMIVAPDSNIGKFYVNGVAVPHMQNIAFNFDQVNSNSVSFGDCCGATSDLNWAIEWFKVEAGVNTPHPAPPAPPAGNVAEWIPDSFGEWGKVSNWAGLTVPNAATGALLGDAITAPRTIINEEVATTKQITFDSNQGYNLAGSGVYRLEADSGNASVEVLQAAVAGVHQFQARVQLGSDTTVTTIGSAALSFNNEVDLAGNTLTISGNVNLNHSVIDSVGGGSIGGSGSLATDGTVTIGGSLSFDGALSVSFSEDGTSHYDVLGVASLSGPVVIDVANGFKAGGKYSILTAGSLIDRGLTLAGPDADMFRLLINEGAGTLSLLAVPEPTTFTASFIGIAVLIFRRRRGTAAWLALLMILAFGASSVHAVVLQPVSAVASSEEDDSNGVRRAIYAIDGSGLDPNASDIQAALHNESGTPVNGGGMWLSLEGLGDSAQITFDLGGTYTLTDMHVWNFAEYAYVCCDLSTRGAKDVNVYVGTDSNTTTFAQSFTFAQAQHTGNATTFTDSEQWGTSYNVPGQTYSFNTPVTARYVKFDILNSYGANRVGISEVRFIGTAVPEASSVSALLLGAAVLVFRWRAKATLLALIATMIFGVSSANAVVIQPVGATASSEEADSNGQRRAIYAVDGSGLDPSPGDVYTKLHNESGHPMNMGGMWLSAEGQATAQITFDLGGLYELNDMHIWNFAEYAYVCCDLSTRGIKDVNVYVGEDPNPTTLAQSFTFAQAMHTAPALNTVDSEQWGIDYNVPGQTYTFNTPVTARYVKFDILNNWGANRVGLAEVRFSGTALVAENSDWVTDNFGDWNDSANWTDATIPSTTRGAKLGGAIDDPQTIINESTATTKAIIFDSSNGYTLAGSGLYRLQAASGNASIQVLQAATNGSHQFQSRVQLGSNTSITTDAAATLDFHHQVDLNGKALTIDGNVNLNQSVTSSLAGGSISGTGSLGTAGPTSFAGNLTFNGTYPIYIDSQNTDHFMISGTANLAGTIEVDVADGFTPAGTYTVFSAANLINGGLTLSGPDAGLFSLQVTPGASGMVNLVAGAAGVTGDYNGNGAVDAADYVAWRKGLALLNEGATPGSNTAEDYTVWRNMFGSGAFGSGSSNGAVPEPATAILVLLCSALCSLPLRCRFWGLKSKNANP